MGYDHCTSTKEAPFLPTKPSLNLVTSRAANFKTSRIDTDMTLLGLFYVFQVSILNCSDDGQSRMCVSETGRDP